MEDKRIKKQIIIHMIIIFLLIIALLYLGFYAYSLKIKLQEIKNTIVINEKNEDDTIIEFNKEDVGTELDKNNDEVKELISKIDFPTYAIASIYKTEFFNLKTIPNDLILRLGWANSEKELIENNIDNIGEYKQTTNKSQFAKSVMNIFGRKLDYTDDSFTNIDVPTFHGYYANRGVINYNNGVYTASYKKGSGDSAFIHQEIQKVLKYSDRIEIYVKTAFIDCEYNNSTKSFEYVGYKNFKEDKFEEKLFETTPTEFRNSYLNKKEEYNSFDSNSKVLNISESLNSYIYTFAIDGNDDNYYLSQFEKVK